MKVKYNILALTIFLLSCQSNSQHRIVVNIPTAEAESAYIWRTIQDINFFEENNYRVILPAHALIDELKRKSKLGKLADDDYGKLKTFVRDSVYSETDYQRGYEKIRNELALINRMINALSQLSFNWNFKTFETYPVNLTLYGPGGSYNAEDGSILIFTTEKGEFKNYDNPSNTIIHEVIHIGIEEAIVTKYHVPHPLKERIVDTFVTLNFGQYLPDYKVQNMGEIRTDQHLKVVADLKELDKIVELILGAK